MIEKLTIALPLILLAFIVGTLLMMTGCTYKPQMYHPTIDEQIMWRGMKSA